MAKIDCSVTVNFLREKERMCATYNLCSNGCPLRQHFSCDTFMALYPEKVVSITQKWSDEHPIDGGATGIK
jgi:hypothetical protein